MTINCKLLEFKLGSVLCFPSRIHGEDKQSSRIHYGPGTTIRWSIFPVRQH